MGQPDASGVLSLCLAGLPVQKRIEGIEVSEALTSGTPWALCLAIRGLIFEVFSETVGTVHNSTARGGEQLHCAGFLEASVTQHRI